MARTADQAEQLERVRPCLAELPFLFAPRLDTTAVAGLGERLAEPVNWSTDLEGEPTVCRVRGRGRGRQDDDRGRGSRRAAQRGRRVLVLTIDPARRLAGALGLPETRRRRARRSDLGTAHGMAGAGSLHAAMLDARRTFDALVREAGADGRGGRADPTTRSTSSSPGRSPESHEYMAMERLYEVWSSGRFDLIVLDTPPSRHALDFLEAPGRVTRFVDGRALRLLVRPGVRAGAFGMRMLGQAPTWRSARSSG